MSWESHCTKLEGLAAGSYEESCIFNADGTHYTPAAPLNYLSSLRVEEFKELIKNHDQALHKSFILDGKHKFISVQQVPDFSLWSYSGTINNTLVKPVMILARTKTTAVLGLFNKRDNNVAHICSVAKYLVDNGC